MAVTFLPETQTFHLTTKNTSYLFRVFDRGYLLSLYWGRRRGIPT